MVHPKCFSQLQKKQKASSAESPSCHQSRERENTGLVLRFLLAGRQAPPPRNAVMWWVRLTAPAPHEETSPQKGNLFATEERETLCGKLCTQNAFSQLQKKQMLHKPNLLCTKQGGVCVCVSEMVHPECFSNAFTPWSIDHPNVWTCSIEFLNMVHRPPKLHLSKSDKSILVYWYGQSPLQQKRVSS